MLKSWQAAYKNKEVENEKLRDLYAFADKEREMNEAKTRKVERELAELRSKKDAKKWLDSPLPKSVSDFMRRNYGGKAGSKRSSRR